MGVMRSAAAEFGAEAVVLGFVEQVDAGNRSSCRSAYRLTRKGFVKWH